MTIQSVVLMVLQCLGNILSHYDFGKVHTFSLKSMPNDIVQDILQSEIIELKAERFNWKNAKLATGLTDNELYEVLIPNVQQYNTYHSKYQNNSKILICDNEKMVNQQNMPLVGVMTKDKNCLRERVIKVQAIRANDTEFLPNAFGGYNTFYQLDLIIVY